MISSLNILAIKLDQAWFLDQFGVLHDGKQPYPGAITTCMFSTVSFGILVRWFVFVNECSLRYLSVNLTKIL